LQFDPTGRSLLWVDGGGLALALCPRNSPGQEPSQCCKAAPTSCQPPSSYLRARTRQFADRVASRTARWRRIVKLSLRRAPLSATFATPSAARVAAGTPGTTAARVHAAGRPSRCGRPTFWTVNLTTTRPGRVTLTRDSEARVREPGSDGNAARAAGVHTIDSPRTRLLCRSRCSRSPVGMTDRLPSVDGLRRGERQPHAPAWVDVAKRTRAIRRSACSPGSTPPAAL